MSSDKGPEGTGVKTYPYEEGDFINLGPEVFTHREQHVISWKGANYYRACDAFVRNTPDGGATYCIRQTKHEDNNHIDFTGHCTGSLHPVGDEIGELPVTPDYIPTVEGGVASPAPLTLVEEKGDSIEQDLATDAEYVVTLSVGCKTLGEVDRVMSRFQSPLGWATEMSLWASLSFYANTED